MLDSKDFENKTLTIPEQLRSIADELERNGSIIEAFHLVLCFEDGRAARVKRYSQDTNLLTLVGLLSVSESETVMEVLKASGKDKYYGS